MNIKDFRIGVQHIGIPTNNIEETINFYQTLGFTTALRTIITEWKSPTAARSQRFSVSIAAIMNTIAPSVTVRSIGRGLTFFIDADTIRPIRNPPQ